MIQFKSQQITIRKNSREDQGMHSESLIVADASPLIGLASINQLKVISELFSEVIIPDEVRIECTNDIRKPGAQHIQEAIEIGKITVIEAAAIENTLEFPQILGIGEAAAIELAYSLKSMLLIDDLWGRKVANNYNIRILGTAGLLVIAKEKNIISRVSTLLDELSSVGYHLSNQLIKKILLLCNEE